MNISELMAQLHCFLQVGMGEAEVVLAKDEEGNAFRRLADVGDIQAMEGAYHVESLWDEDGEEHLTEVPEDNPDAFLAIVLWP